MTANLTVPADVWACRQPGVPFVAAIVEEERRPCSPRADLCGHDLCGIQPPAWLVALRDARCGNISTHRVSPGQCTDCVDGRLLHDVRVECPNDCYPVGSGVCTFCGEFPNGPEGPHRNRGYRTVRCLVDIVKVKDRETWWERPRDERSLIVNEAGEVFLFTPYPPAPMTPLGVGTQLTPTHVEALAAACGKPPADWVGGYAVILTEVGE